jgi:hypothetical protein
LEQFDRIWDPISSYLSFDFNFSKYPIILFSKLSIPRFNNLVGTAWGHKGHPRYQFYHFRPERFGRVIGGFFGPFSTVSVADANVLHDLLIKNATHTNGRMATFGDEVGNALMYVPYFKTISMYM